MSDFAKLHAAIFETAKKNLKREGRLTPVGVICAEKTKAINTIVFQWQNNAEKARNIAAFGATAFLTGSDYAYLILDAAIGTVEDKERGIMPLDKPLDDLREIIIVIGFEIHPSLEHAARVVEYRRSGSDRRTISFKESLKTDFSHKFDGDMVDWFRDGWNMAKWNMEHPEVSPLVCEHGRRHGTFCPLCKDKPDASAA